MPEPDQPDGTAEPAFGLDEAYGVESPDDNRELYRRWADTYESGFIEPRGYVYHEGVVQQFLASGGAGPVLDVGCGTGIVGQALRAAGTAPVDGVDISPEMLAKAGEKRTDDGDTVYRELIEADLTQQTSIAAGTYAGIVSVGVFTHGHLGPVALDDLFRVGAPGCRFALGINAEHFVEQGFAAALGAAAESGTISAHQIAETRIYTLATDEHAEDMALVVLFERLPGA